MKLYLLEDLSVYLVFLNAPFGCPDAPRLLKSVQPGPLTLQGSSPVTSGKPRAVSTPLHVPTAQGSHSRLMAGSDLITVEQPRNSTRPCLELSSEIILQPGLVIGNIPPTTTRFLHALCYCNLTLVKLSPIRTFNNTSWPSRQTSPSSTYQETKPPWPSSSSTPLTSTASSTSETSGLTFPPTASMELLHWYGFLKAFGRKHEETFTDRCPIFLHK